MFTPKEIVDFLKESMKDNNWYVDTKKIGTPPNHRFFSPTLVRNHVAEAYKQLSAKQKKIAAMGGDKDKIDAEDFKKLRSMKEHDLEKLGKKYEKAEKDDAEKRDTYSKKYPGGEKQKAADKEAFMKRFAEDTTNEVAPPGFEGTVKAMKGKKGIDNPWALAWSMKKKGYKSHIKSMKENNDSHTHAAHFTNEKGEWSGMVLIDAKDDDDAIDQAHQISAGDKWKNFKLASVEKHVPIKDMKEEAAEQVEEGSSEFNAMAKRHAKADAEEKAKQDTYSKKYPGGKKQRDADVAAFLKRFPAPKNEEVEQIDEASAVDTLKADGKHKEAGAKAFELGLDRKYGQHFGLRHTKNQDEAAFHSGYDQAEARSKKKVDEEAEQIDEISSKTASSYATKAWASDDDKRAKGLNLAINKMAASKKVKVPTSIKEEEMRPEIQQIIEDATTKAWMNVHTKGSKAQREKLDKVHAKNPKYHTFKKSLEGHSSGPAEKPKAAAKPAATSHKDAEETPAQKLRRINSERQKAYYAKGGSRGVGSAGTSANQSPLEKKLGGHDVSHLEKKKTASLGASPSEREKEKADKKEAPKPGAVERKPARLTGKVGL